MVPIMKFVIIIILLFHLKDTPMVDTSPALKSWIGYD
jgi:fumarylacetoacetase